VVVNAITTPSQDHGRCELTATGKDPLLTVRAPRELIATIDSWAAKEGLARSDAVRQLIEFGLKTRQSMHACSLNFR
jgi:hypothetical protein